MTVTIALQDAKGRKVESASDVHDFVHSVACERPQSVLAGADPTDDTELTGTNLDRFRNEWQEAEALVVSDPERRTWDEIRSMADRAAKDADLRLVLLSG